MTASMPSWIQKRVEETPWVYAEVGKELRLSSRDSPYLNGINVATCHELKTYLHLVDGVLKILPHGKAGGLMTAPESNLPPVQEHNGGVEARKEVKKPSWSQAIIEAVRDKSVTAAGNAQEDTTDTISTEVPERLSPVKNDAATVAVEAHVEESVHVEDVRGDLEINGVEADTVLESAENERFEESNIGVSLGSTVLVPGACCV
ncbi:hypothetical protein F2Q69_00010694 [Brassica cretica]|uniref:Uncharacterized protein n=1 Tax=Brassica cretica TaxID=69181 RepID=A0A8S9R6D1_BRACR|nr:hypothetical protein F2Q69_00010694 [Brassica cretica]